MPLIRIPSAAPTAPTAVPLIRMPLAAPTATQLAAPTATQLTAMQLAAPAATPLLPIMSVRPNQMGYFAGAPSNFYPQGNQFPNMTNPCWEASQREQFLQNQLLQERQQFEAWKAHKAQPQPQLVQGQAPPLVPLEPTVIVKAPDNNVEVISVRSTSAKRAVPPDQASTNVSKCTRSSGSASRRSKCARSSGSTQHFADPSLPTGTTLEGLILSRSHPRPVLAVLRRDLCRLRT